MFKIYVHASFCEQTSQSTIRVFTKKEEALKSFNDEKKDDLDLYENDYVDEEETEPRFQEQDKNNYYVYDNEDHYWYTTLQEIDLEEYPEGDNIWVVTKARHLPGDSTFKVFTEYEEAQEYFESEYKKDTDGMELKLEQYGDLYEKDENEYFLDYELMGDSDLRCQIHEFEIKLDEINELKKIIMYDLGCIAPKNEDDEYHYNLVKGNLEELFKLI